MEENTSETSAISVIIYTGFRIITGILHLQPGLRLSDRLNASKDDFLTLHDPRIIDLQQGWMEPVPERKPWFVHRQETLVLHAVSSAEADASAVGIPTEKVPKCPMRIRAYTGMFRVEGTFYIPPDCEIATYLNQATKPFLPLTSVIISFPSRTDLDVVQVPFALLNRSRLIISLQDHV